MKKINLFCSIFLMAILLFTSCLGDGDNKFSTSDVGVIGYSKTYKTVMYVNESDCIYSTADLFSGYNEGDCCIAAYEINNDDPTNSNENVKENGYYTVTVSQRAKIDQYYMGYNLTDTSTVLPNETPVKEAQYGFRYVKGRLFLWHVIEELEKQQTTWDISYDPAFNNITENNLTRNRIYDIFLRSTIQTKGTGNKTDALIVNAYNMVDYFNQVARRENDLGKKEFNIRINYVSSIDTTTNTMVWSKGNEITLPINLILPESAQN